MNILATYHPAEKDYGFIKINEPDTPFLRLMDDGTEEGTSSKTSNVQEEHITPEALAERLAVMDGIPAKILQSTESFSRTSFGDEDFSPEAKEEAMQFLKKRKAHYDEGKYLRMRWQTLHDEEDVESEDEAGTVPVKHTKKKETDDSAFKDISTSSKMGWYNWFRMKSENLRKKSENSSSGMFRNNETEEQQQLGKEEWNDEEESKEQRGSRRQRGGRAPYRGR
uniref:Protein phosphatase inhibitor 2-like n=1 Tax=Geotrypetes seraphini TaxID=260995 RepID=A0A6P8PVG2_GEOSA|nr:protein phosphatase inhibitor 2-like [Geotrypetes seraphini]